MADQSLQRTTFLLYRTVWLNFYTARYKFLYVLVGYFILILKKCMKCVLRIMRTWERMRNFNISKRICGFKGYNEINQWLLLSKVNWATLFH